jgi:hypothetical protein
MKKKWFLLMGVLVLFYFAGEWLYFQSIYQTRTNDLSTGDAVLVYGGSLRRDAAGLALANQNKIPIFISDVFGGPKDFQQKIGRSNMPITIDHYARTTDQNARNAVKFLKQGGYQKALLVTSWYHMPRALFLTRFYLLGAFRDSPPRRQDAKEDPDRGMGFRVEPYFFEPIPKNYWTQPDFWAEMFRFWGSLGRVALANFGFEKPVFHYFD